MSPILVPWGGCYRPNLARRLFAAKLPNEFHIFVDAFGTAHHITRLFVAGLGFQTLPTCRGRMWAAGIKRSSLPWTWCSKLCPLQSCKKKTISCFGMLRCQLHLQKCHVVHHHDLHVVCIDYIKVNGYQYRLVLESPWVIWYIISIMIVFDPSGVTMLL